MLSNSVIFNLGSAKVCSPTIIETYFSYDKDIQIAVTDYYMYSYLIVLFLLVAILQLINFTASCFLLKTFFLLNVVFSTNVIWAIT